MCRGQNWYMGLWPSPRPSKVQNIMAMYIINPHENGLKAIPQSVSSHPSFMDIYIIIYIYIYVVYQKKQLYMCNHVHI